jgi:hypothetical protein
LIGGAALLLLVVVQPVFGQIVIRPHTAQALASCGDEHFFNSRTANPPAIVAHSFRGQGSVVTFRICTDVEGNTHYFIRKPRPNRNGICRVFEQELFPGTEQDVQIIDVLYDGTAPGWYFTMPGWKSWPPENWAKLHYDGQSQILAQESEGACPPGDDSRYMPVGTMTDGMLGGFFKLWRKVSSSPEAFDSTFANTTSAANTGLGSKEDHAALVQALRDELFTKGRARPTLEFFDCGIGSLSGCSAYFDEFVIGFDVAEQGLVITRIDSVLVP